TAVHWPGASAPRPSRLRVSVWSPREGRERLSERTLAGLALAETGHVPLAATSHRERRMGTYTLSSDAPCRGIQRLHSLHASVSSTTPRSESGNATLSSRCAPCSAPPGTIGFPKR